VQEKIMRQPESISVCLAELLPRKRQRESQDHNSDYFSAVTYWSSDKLWRFIGVDFSVVSIAIREAAKAFKEQLKEGLRTLLPENQQREKRQVLGRPMKPAPESQELTEEEKAEAPSPPEEPVKDRPTDLFGNAIPTDLFGNEIDSKKGRK
jgi:hypothetical protein